MPYFTMLTMIAPLRVFLLAWLVWTSLLMSAGHVLAEQSNTTHVSDKAFLLGNLEFNAKSLTATLVTGFEGEPDKTSLVVEVEQLRRGENTNLPIYDGLIPDHLRCEVSGASIDANRLAGLIQAVKEAGLPAVPPPAEWKIAAAGTSRDQITTIDIRSVKLSSQVSDYSAEIHGDIGFDAEGALASLDLTVRVDNANRVIDTFTTGSLLPIGQTVYWRDLVVSRMISNADKSGQWRFEWTADKPLMINGKAIDQP